MLFGFALHRGVVRGRLQVDPGQEEVRVGRDLGPLPEQFLQLFDAGTGALQLEEDAGMKETCLGPHVPAGQYGLDLGQGGGVFAPAEQIFDQDHGFLMVASASAGRSNASR